MHQRPDGVEVLSRSPRIIDRVRELVPVVVLAWPFTIPLLTPEDEPCTGSSAPPSFSQRLIAFAFSSVAREASILFGSLLLATSPELARAGENELRGIERLCRRAPSTVTWSYSDC